MATPALLEDYLFLAPLIAERLADQVADVPVKVCETAEQVLQADNRARVLMVLWAGDVLGDVARDGASQALTQRWLVALGLNNAGKNADARNLAAGPVLSQVHKALSGWTPAGTGRAMRRAPSRLPPTHTPAKAVYPLGFEIQLTL